MKPAIILVLLSTALPLFMFVNGRSTGAPLEACLTLIPQHPDIIPQMQCDLTNCGFRLRLEPTVISSDPLPGTYQCGANHTVILESIGQETFRGFLVQARASSQTFSPQAQFLGRFSNLSSSQLLHCEQVQGSGITHVNNTDKREVHFIWTAPETPQNVTFWYTVVADFSQIYVQLNEEFVPDLQSCLIAPTILPTLPPLTGTPPPTEISLFSISPSGTVRVVEGNSQTVCVTRGLVRANVWVFTESGSASDYDDFQSVNMILNFDGEENTACIEINTINDHVLESTEVFFVHFRYFEDEITLRVLIEDNTTVCADDEFLCNGEPLCIPQEYVCDGITDCLYKQDESNCSMSPCQNEGSFRLRGGPTTHEGLVEVCYEGQFRSFGIDQFPPVFAPYVCSALGYQGGIWVSAWREFQTVGRGLLLSDCIVNGTRLVDCTYSEGSINHLSDAGIRCLDEAGCAHGSTRLVGGTTLKEGAVHVCIFGFWGFVYSNNWYNNEASVVCRSLGYDESGALPLPRIPYFDVSNDTRIMLDSVRCTGFEYSLGNCSSDIVINRDSYNGYFVGVRCEDRPPTSECSNGDIRLSNRTSEVQGVVEVCNQGRWLYVIYDGSWSENETNAVCQKLNQTEDQNLFYLQSIPAIATFLLCTTNDMTTLQCSRNDELRRQRGVSFYTNVVGVTCAQFPEIIVIPPNKNGNNYTLQKRRNFDQSIECRFAPNRHHVRSLIFQSFRVREDNKLTMIERGEVGVPVFSNGTVIDSDAGTYLCIAQHQTQNISTNVTINITVQKPSGPSSEVYIRLSIPRASDRLRIILDFDRVQDILNAMEDFLIYRAFDQRMVPGQRTVHCSQVNRTQEDDNRKRDRYECVLVNFPPQDDKKSFTIIRNTMVEFLEAQNFAISAINISDIGFCDTDYTVDGVWPETEANTTRQLQCEEGGVVMRQCSGTGGGQWLEPSAQCNDVTPSEFRCSSDGQLIPIAQKCDGIGHCLRLEDESQCPAPESGCRNGDVRLTQGISDNDGIVEYCINQTWGSFCPQTISLDDANVVCRQLGLPIGAILLPNVQSLVFPHSINFTCRGSESSLTNCDESEFKVMENSSCVQNFNRAAISCQVPENCNDGELRLSGGDADNEGNVEICFNRVWGSVCSNGGDVSINEARVMCRQLGYNAAGAMALPFQYYPFNPNTITFRRVLDCRTGSESRLTDCQITEDIVNNCSPTQIRCDDYPLTENCANGAVRLRDREHTSEGALEICVDGRWGYFCGALFNEAANVVCRELGFEPGVSDVVNYRVARREGAIHFEMVFCNGTESSLAQCNLIPSGDNVDCSTIPYILCQRRPSIYLSPPPPSDNIYEVDIGQNLEVHCRTERTFPHVNATIHYQTGDASQSSCFESGEGEDSEVIDGAVSQKDGGIYHCVSCNDFGISNISFTVVINPQGGRGSSVFVRLSVPILSRLSQIVGSNITEENRLPGLESLITSAQVISQAEGTQMVQCQLINKTREDTAAQRDRYECNITTYPPIEPELGIQLAQRMSNEVRRENLLFTSSFLISGTGICDSEVDMTEWGTYIWPEAVGGSTATLQCVPDMSINVTRQCLSGGRWDSPSYAACALQSLGSREVSADEDFSATSALVVSAIQETDESQQTSDNVERVAQYLISRVDFILENDFMMIDSEFVGNVVEVLDGLQDWPAEALQNEDRGSQIVQAFEAITIGLAQQENFTEIKIENENIAVRIETVDTSTLTDGRSFGVSDGNGTLDATVGSEDTLAPGQIAAGFLPLSLFQIAESKQSDSNPIPVVYAVFGSGSLFSIEGNQDGERNTTVGSPVVSLTVGVNKVFVDLPDPVVVDVRITVEEKFVNPRCVSYDFDLKKWVTDGCTTTYNQNSDIIMCECDHLTNFASLVDICSRTDDNCGDTKETKLALDIISIIGVILSGIGLILTILTFLLFGKLRKRDASKFHVQLSLALLGMLLVFVVGIDRTEVFEGCVTVSVLIHYFTLVAVMWMGAEALLMFQKLVIVFVQITTSYLVILSLVCWLVPIVPAIIPPAIDPNFSVTNTDTNHFCFIGDVRVFFAAFLGPIFAVLLFNLVMYIIVIVVLIRHSRNKLGKTVNDKQQRKKYIRLGLSLVGVMILFGLTWVIGAFTISEASVVFQILFAIFNSLQGFFIFIFFCVLSSDVRQLWLKVLTCGRYAESKPSTSSAYKKGASSGKPYSGSKQTNTSTASSGLSSLPTNQYASESSAAFELSENPLQSIHEHSTDPTSDTIVENEYVSQPENKLPRVVGPPTTSHAHFYKNPSAVDGEGPTTNRNLGYGSMSAHVSFK